jgi:hypothetical protein
MCYGGIALRARRSRAVRFDGSSMAAFVGGFARKLHPKERRHNLL